MASSNDTIVINSFEELKKKMETMEFYVSWTVYSDIGPDWMGSYRKINFELDDFPLETSEFLDILQEKLTTTLNIPETSEDLVIDGYAYIILENNALFADYEWTAAVPYDEVSEEDDGKIQFYP